MHVRIRFRDNSTSDDIFAGNGYIDFLFGDKVAGINSFYKKDD